jgi:AraC-like DNA-binding protein
MKVRLSIAKLLLENTNLPITEISSKSGFFTPNRFSEVFKQKVKLTPTEYRRIYNKNFNPSIKTP